MKEMFRRFAAATSEAAGSPWMFMAALSVIVVWAVSGPMFGFSDTWQLVINTGTTIVTFLMVFLVQNTQNRDNKAIHLKLDELLRALEGARTSMVNLEDMSDEELVRLHQEFTRLKDARKLHEQIERSQIKHERRREDVEKPSVEPVRDPS